MQQGDPIVPKAEETMPGRQSSSPQVQRPCSTVEGDDDEINLLDLFIILLKHKGMILSVVILAGIAAALISILMTDIYRSECTISPIAQEKISGSLAALGGLGAMIASEVGIGATGSLDQFDVVLKSRELTNIVVKQNNLMPVVFEKFWDVQTGGWKVRKPSVFQNAYDALREILKPQSEKRSAVPKYQTLQDAYKEMQDMLQITADRKQNVVRISFEHKDPKMAQTILNSYVAGLSEFLRRQTVEETAAQRVHLTEQLAQTTDPLLKNRLYELIAKLIEKETLAKIQRYYSFNVIDPPFVPDRKFKPKRLLICILSVVVAFFVAIFLAFFLEYVHNLKKREDPERLANLEASLRLRS
jgi:uncharacterized protein involved in exopolysaccharide biosynthesis